jgi:histidyl-tRNA synthetase
VVKYSALKGAHDIFPPEIFIWQAIESAAREIFSRYGYQEIRTPVIESTAIFVRSIGETTDIVDKEMYTFPDRAGRSITLRPEGTASVVRAYVENHLDKLPSPQKFFYSGPMFRYERPQKGRFRQFYQIGVEAFGVTAPEIDAEMLSMVRVFLGMLDLRELTFELNSIGCEICRPSFTQALIGFFSGKLMDLCPDCRKRYEVNPLRILDCKVDRCVEIRQGSPKVSDFLCSDCMRHFGDVLLRLNVLEIPYVINTNLVRGLDYYTSTTFEVTCERLGSQKAVVAGGRYNRLVEEFGGHSTPAIGFALGMERLAALMKEGAGMVSSSPHVFIAALGNRAAAEGLVIAEKLRARGFRIEAAYEGSSLKSQLRRADRLAARYALLIGDDELGTGRVKWKNLRDGSQGEADLSGLDGFVSSLFSDTGE